MKRFSIRFGEVLYVGHDAVMTMSEVARCCGVSPATVSAALHGTGRVSRQRGEEIRRKARELGYRPKMAARMLRSHRTGHLGLILPGNARGNGNSGGYAWPLLRTFTSVCEDLEIPYNIEFYGKQREGVVLPDQLAGGVLDGCLLGGFVNEELRAALKAQTEWPWVSIEEPAEHCVLLAADRGIYEAVQYLAALGHRRVAFATGLLRYSTHRLGLNGFRRAVAEFALSVQDLWVYADENETVAESMAGHVAWAGEILDQSPRPSAVVCHGMGTASAVIYAAMLRGLQLPRDLSLVALGLGADAQLRYPAVSCVEPDFVEMVGTGVRLLQRLLAGHEVSTEPHWVCPRLLPRMTTGPVGGKLA
jgi:LacI family transcriptional regulator